MRRAARLLLISCGLALFSCTSSDTANNTSADFEVGAETNAAMSANAADTVVPKDQGILCDAIGERVSQSDCDDVNAMQSKVREGAAALNVPDPMKRGHPYSVSLNIDLRKLEVVEQLDVAMNTVEADLNTATEMNVVDTVDANAMNTVENGNSTAPSPPDRPSSHAPPTPLARARSEEGKDVPFIAAVSRRMRATLTGHGFDIKAIDPANGILTIPENGSGRWEWEVIPRQDGQRRLTVHTEAVAHVGNRDVLIGNAESFKDVQISVTPGDRLRDALKAAPDWLKLLTGVLAALAALLGAWFGLKRVWKKGDA